MYVYYVHRKSGSPLSLVLTDCVRLSEDAAEDIVVKPPVAEVEIRRVEVEILQLLVRPVKPQVAVQARGKHL